MARRAGSRAVSDTLPISVVIPTVGRPELLSNCLASLAECDPRADEILVIDQSANGSVREVVDHYSHSGARAVELDVKNKSLALNLGLGEARHEIVLVTDDDCTVDRSWASAAWTHMAADPDIIITGRVLAVGEPNGVPSTIDAVASRDYTGVLHYGALYGGNMACNRSLVLALGGFDERFEAAEDNDLCYRWLRSGRRLRFEPDLVVWHHAWRTPEQMSRLYLAYGRGQGMLYAKHLRRGDLRIAPFLAQDLYRGARGVAARMVKGRSEWPDPRIGLLAGIVRGLAGGARSARSKRAPYAA
jgi:GT2 family glycosyltransferase